MWGEKSPHTEAGGYTPRFTRMQDLPDQLRTFRKSLRLSQTEAAALCGVSLSAWTRWERRIAVLSPHAWAGCMLLLVAPYAETLSASRRSVQEAG